MAEKQILLAIHPLALELVDRALGAEFRKIVCHNLKEAQEHLTADIGLVACGVYFDEGLMFDLLRAVRASSVAASAPFYLILGAPTDQSEAMLRGIQAAAKILGATEFIDLPKLIAELGEDGAYEHLRNIARAAVTGQ